MEILSIKERDVVLPDGHYSGKWGGYTIEVDHGVRKFELETEVGVRGIGIEVLVKVKDGVATFKEK